MVFFHTSKEHWEKNKDFFGGFFGLVLTQFFSMYIVSNCYQLVIGETIWFGDLVQLLLDNMTLS